VTSTQTITVNVTQEHISKGWKGDCYDCPIALALRPLIGEAYKFQVQAGYVLIEDDPEPVPFRIAIPKICTSFIAAFDMGETVKPFQFQIDLPQRVISPNSAIS